MKRTIALALCAVLALSLLAGCSDRTAEESSLPSDPAETASLPLPTPTPEPSQEPSAEPSLEPSAEPSDGPSQEPSLPLEVKPIPTTPTPAPTPKPTPKPTPAPTPAPEPTPTPAAGVDLAAFYKSVTGQYQFAFMVQMDDTTLDQWYAGLTSLSLAQSLVYQCGMSPSPNGDFALVQVKNAADVDAVKAIFQARIDYMVGDGNGPGGALYPMEMTTWEENARIAANGDCVMLIVHENCDDIVAAFNALF